MSERLRRGLLWVVQIALTLAATHFLFRSLRLSWSELEAVDGARWRPNVLPLLASVAALLFVFLYLVALWARMIRALGGPRLRLTEATRIFFLANLGRYIPGKVWQLAGLAYLAGQRGVPLPVASTSAVLGQLYSLGAAACLGAFGFVLAAGPVSRLPSGLVAGALILAVTVAIFLLVPAALRLVLRLAFHLSRRGQPPRLDAWFGPRWLALYLPAWAGYGLAFGLLWATFPALGRVSWQAAMGGFAAAYFLGYAAIFAPAGVGVREGAMAVLLAPWLGAAEAAVLAVVARIWMTAVELLPLVALAGGGAVRWLRGDDEERGHVI